jgi:hypothetical protein
MKKVLGITGLLVVLAIAAAPTRLAPVVEPVIRTGRHHREGVLFGLAPT